MTLTEHIAAMTREELNEVRDYVRSERDRLEDSAVRSRGVGQAEIDEAQTQHEVELGRRFKELAVRGFRLAAFMRLVEAELRGEP